VRRGSLAVLLGIGVTQGIYFLTGTLILHPVAASLLGVVASAFWLMARMMRRELESVLEQSEST
jgi:hypothetical protein